MRDKGAIAVAVAAVRGIDAVILDERSGHVANEDEKRCRCELLAALYSLITPGLARNRRDDRILAFVPQQNWPLQGRALELQQSCLCLLRFQAHPAENVGEGDDAGGLELVVDHVEPVQPVLDQLLHDVLEARGGPAAMGWRRGAHVDCKRARMWRRGHAHACVCMPLDSIQMHRRRRDADSACKWASSPQYDM